MNRFLIIDKCDDCCFFDNEYYSYEEKCIKLNNRKIERIDRGFQIPDDCPLQEVRIEELP